VAVNVAPKRRNAIEVSPALGIDEEFAFAALNDQDLLVFAPGLHGGKGMPQELAVPGNQVGGRDARFLRSERLRVTWMGTRSAHAGMMGPGAAGGQTMFGRQSQADQEAGGGNGRGEGDPYRAAREDMIENQLRRRGVVRHSVLEAMRAVPRHLFVRHDLAHRAYADEALPSQEGQTISQPYMVAVMTQELDVKPGHRVLELGTGTGYQTAILARLAGPQGRIYTIERVAALAEFARHRLTAMNIEGIHFHVGDGSKGWPRDDPAWDGPRSNDRFGGAEPGEPQFDRIMVTAGAPAVPRPLLAQLRDGGIMVVPIGTSESQMLVRVERREDRVEENDIMACRFVPLVGAHAWDMESYARMQRDKTQQMPEGDG
jgi:protein-L-isoaspartate(D-aspartate) O-methyltransferase